METNQTVPEADSETPGSGPVPEDARDHDDAAGAADSSGRTAAAGQHAGGAAGSAPDPSRDAHGGDPADRAAGPGFYAWLRRLGVPRRAGWLGGVCAGVGARIGVDPIIVRGIVVVIAVLGAPFVLVYAIAWLLLPDTEGEIHLERLMRGTVDPAIVGIAVMGVIGFIPLVQGGWLGWRWWPEWPSLYVGGLDLVAPLRIVWALAIVGAIVALIVWLVHRASRNTPAGGGERVASAPATGPGQPAADAPTEAAASAAASAPFVAAAVVAPATPPPTGEPEIPPMGADAAEIADWRARQEAWRESQAAWKSSQAEAARLARQEAAEENRARARQLAAQADAARAARRAARPRASAAFVFTMLGLAVVAGAVAAIWALGEPDTAEFTVPLAISVATMTLALGMIVAALLRRRSGALAALTAVSLVATFAGAAGVYAPNGTLIGPNASISLGYPQQLVQPVGDALITMGAYDGYPDDAQVVTLTQGTGDAYLMVDEYSTVAVDATEAGDIDITLIGRDGSRSSVPVSDAEGRVFRLSGDESRVISAPSSGKIDAWLILRQGSGSVTIEIQKG
ncbi:PspC domain-containing protein [Agromyces endophyticus]|uniref:PspC domain-containing protein n=1 Tax=Agromyces sp. H17E-10 TaxID=2932244 RepID=UPI001FD0AF1A|nr:PspC domain-containing protein [Agromyces sp. H17E-10]UOQ90444.1 PspC domain-containing protein [Agromyces sp. H17E-10]